LAKKPATSILLRDECADEANAMTVSEAFVHEKHKHQIGPYRDEGHGGRRMGAW
jgi:hypothetical protein